MARCCARISRGTSTTRRTRPSSSTTCRRSSRDESATPWPRAGPERPARGVFHARGGRVRRFVVRRILLAILVLWGVATIVFVLTRTLPGNPVAIWVGPKPTHEQLVRARHDLGLDKPVPVQYVAYLKELVR